MEGKGGEARGKEKTMERRHMQRQERDGDEEEARCYMHKNTSEKCQRVVWSGSTFSTLLFATCAPREDVIYFFLLRFVFYLLTVFLFSAPVTLCKEQSHGTSLSRYICMYRAHFHTHPRTNTHPPPRGGCC